MSLHMVASGACDARRNGAEPRFDLLTCESQHGPKLIMTIKWLLLNPHVAWHTNSNQTACFLSGNVATTQKLRGVPQLPKSKPHIRTHQHQRHDL